MISDFQCPYCKRWHDESMAKFRRDYIDRGKVRFAYLHLPLESIHPHARAEAEASLCAGAQGKFWPYADAIFGAYDATKGMSNVTPLLTRFARELSLDLPAFEQCRTSPAIRDLVSNDIAQATRAGVQSTPSFIIGEFLVQGALPYPDFSKAVDSALVVAKNRKARGTTR
jgi:protein-disulfide isomerase